MLQVSAQDYLSASPDPVARFSNPICKHMNDDHADAIAAIVLHCSGLKVCTCISPLHACAACIRLLLQSLTP
jgi:pyruvate/2-oxoglutarate/acetoin dehydrogenase E1 component